MKKGKYILKIDKPCGKDWEAMKATDIGRFCGHCSHSVIDFTNLSDSQVLAIIEKGNGKICGRFDPSQLNRLIVQTNNASNNSQLYKILAGMLLLATANNVIARPPLIDTATVVQTISTHTTRKALIGFAKPAVKANATANTVSGKLIGRGTKLPIAHAHVVLKGTKCSTLSDARGVFHLHVPDSLLANKMTFTIMDIGWQTKEFIVKRDQLPFKKEVAMEPKDFVLGCPKF